MNKKVLWIIVLVLLVLGGEKVIKVDNEEVLSIPSPRIFQEEAHEPLIQKTLSTVLRVIDGDTIEVSRNGISEKVRLIGVNTPETVDPRKKVECFGKEASRFVTDILTGTSVSLEADVSQGERDRYGRLLRYVYLPNGTLLNKTIIAEGYGYEYTYRVPYRYMNEFKEAQSSAKKLQKGLWADGVCE
ncbi:MAG: hypothetical protein A3B07_03080 [Candidatus Yonathbacteria bacterium RIFCSPLOWO2_01_FULL_43_27]|uniref:TNase-like domain-containing protein n=2 Tax=Parcubacteria group TaxID=1794811 RepID=A0A1G2SCT2_9BACT|nr:MAG: Nuclease (SNase domain protein) [Candidatus Azambacteria bacterium GW2011_GWA1_44_9]OHA78772.1 MAG: hypothetical protein A2658_00040 [Candidatus Yonathbacteria bacterium RIFCSPHIGHO2_01_FULL_44_19]OHA82847.1 MAG: hypothetical protein A3B07_03080 [Candidatus Yonathbacteria bacterium RIFCSPLOWO2_01_FULL_43_27]